MTLPTDAYREWLRRVLSPELGVRRADLLVQSAATKRGWPAMQVFGPREVVAVLQDVYSALREELGDARADKWVETTTQALSVFMGSVPAPPAPPAAGRAPVERVQPPVKWGRRAHDLPLLQARVHHETAQRSLESIRQLPELGGLERAALWDVQATHAELRRWEAEDRLSSMRAEHARAEMVEQVRSARAQERLLELTVRELEGELRDSEAAQRRATQPQGSVIQGGPAVSTVPAGGPGSRAPLRTQLAHNTLMLSQTRAFLEVFAPLVDTADEAQRPPDLQVTDLDLDARRLDEGVQRHPNVLRAQHTLNYAEWQAGAGAGADARVQEARQALALVEQETAQLLQNTFNTARQHQLQYSQLRTRSQELERRLTQLGTAGADPLSLARVQFEAQQLRAAMRVHQGRLLEAALLLDALGGRPEGT